MLMVYHNIVMFPELTRQAMLAYPELCITDRRVAGRYLTNMITDSYFNPVDCKLPDISIYEVDTKKWKHIFVPVEETRKIRTKRENYIYYPKLLECNNDSLVLSYLISHSDVRLSVLHETKASSDS